MANERTGMDSKSVGGWPRAASQAYLPPRSPLFPGGAPTNPDNNSFFSNWPKLPHPAPNRRHHQRTPSTSFLPQTPAWVDDLLNDTPDVPPVKNGHRRSSSDSMAFLEAPLQHAHIQDIAEEEELDSGCMEPRISGGSGGTDQLNEDRMSARFAENAVQKQHNTQSKGSMHYSLPSERRSQLDASSAPSDHDSANTSSLDDKRARASGQPRNDNEVQSPLKAEQTPSPCVKGEALAAVDVPLDPKRAKRILANRQSAQRSRVRKLQYISELERTVNVLQEEVSALSPQVTYLDRHRIILNVDNSAMKQRIAALAQEKLFKDAHNEALKTELHRLRQLYQQQQQQKPAQQPNMPRQLSQQQQFDIPMSPQLEAPDHDIVGLDVSHCVDEMLALRPPLIKAVGGPSSCGNVNSDKGKDVHMNSVPALAQLHADFRVQNT